MTAIADCRMYTAAVALLAASAALLPEPGIATLRHGAGRGLLEAAEEGGGSPTVTIETEGSRSECTSSANSRTFTAMRNAHVDVVSSLVTAFCDPDFDGFVEQAVNNASDFAVAFATALAETQSECVSMGNAFGCSSASATAAAWARATAQAHANAAAEAVEQCSCDVDLLSLSFTSATTFRELTADVLASAETRACVAGNQESFARAYSSCTAVSYAVVWGRVCAQPCRKRCCKPCCSHHPCIARKHAASPTTVSLHDACTCNGSHARTVELPRPQGRRCARSSLTWCSSGMLPPASAPP